MRAYHKPLSVCSRHTIELDNARLTYALSTQSISSHSSAQKGGRNA